MAHREFVRPTFANAEERFTWLEQQPMRRVSSFDGFLRGVLSSIQDIIANSRLLLLLTKRELKARYKDSILGYLWTLVKPLVSLLIYYLAIGKVLGAERSIPDFAVYVFAGLTVWTFFSTVVSSATSSIIANAGIVKKVYLPRELFPLTATMASIVDFLSQLAILAVGAMLIRGVDLLSIALYVPLAFLLLLIWAIAIGLLLSAINVYLRDIQYLVEVAILLGFWLTPSVYSYSMILDKAAPWLCEIYLWNPTALAVMAFQKGFWVAGSDAVWPPDLLNRMALLSLIGLFFLFIAQRVFAYLQRDFAQEM